MEIKPNEISGLIFYNMDFFEDNRGFFTRNFCKTKIIELGGFGEVNQANLSFNRFMGTVRGFHFQLNGFEEAKTVTVLSGSLHYKVIDLRKSSSTYLKYTSFNLNSLKQVVQVPKGCAPAFQTLEDETLLHYYVSTPYSSNHESGIRYNDSYFNFKWPLKISEVSERDSSFQDFSKEQFAGLESN